MNTFEQNQANRILSLYGDVPVSVDESQELLSPSELSRVLDIQKGGVEAGLGETRNWNGRAYKKTVDGWKFQHKLTAKDPKDATHERDSSSSKTTKDVESAVKRATEVIKDAKEDLEEAKEKDKKKAEHKKEDKKD